MKTFAKNILGVAFVFLQNQIALAWLLNSGEYACDIIGDSLPEGCICEAEQERFQLDCTKYKVLGQTEADFVADFSSICSDPAAMAIKENKGETLDTVTSSDEKMMIPIPGTTISGNQLYVEGKMEGVPVKSEKWRIQLSLGVCGKFLRLQTGKVLCTDKKPGNSGDNFPIQLVDAKLTEEQVNTLCWKEVISPPRPLFWPVLLVSLFLVIIICCIGICCCCRRCKTSSSSSTTITIKTVELAEIPTAEEVATAEMVDVVQPQVQPPAFAPLAQRNGAMPAPPRPQTFDPLAQRDGAMPALPRPPPPPASMP